MSLKDKIIPSHHGTVAKTEAEPRATCRPYYETDETDNGYGVTVYLPGVAKEGLEITDEGGELRIAGKRSAATPAGAATLHRESVDADYELLLAHDATVDTGKIEAELKDGILRVALAKAESAKPRKISVS